MLSDATKIAILKSAPKLSHIELIELVAEECRLAPRAWVRLTYEEVQEILLDPRFQLKPVIVHAVEQRLKEKNHYA